MLVKLQALLSVLVQMYMPMMSMWFILHRIGFIIYIILFFISLAMISQKMRDPVTIVMSFRVPSLNLAERRDYRAMACCLILRCCLANGWLLWGFLLWGYKSTASQIYWNFAASKIETFGQEDLVSRAGGFVRSGFGRIYLKFDQILFDMPDFASCLALGMFGVVLGFFSLMMLIYIGVLLQRMVCICSACDTLEKRAMRGKAAPETEKVKRVAEAVWKHLKDAPTIVAEPFWQVQETELAAVKIKTMQFWNGPCLHQMGARVLGLFGLQVGTGHTSWVPGGIILELGVVTLHVMTDILATWNYCRSRSFWLASILFFMYAYHMLKFRYVYFDLRAQVQTTIAKGFYTAELIHLRDSQRGVQGIPVFLVSAFGWIWAVSGKGVFFTQVLQLALGMYGIAAFSVERELRGHYFTSE